MDALLQSFGDREGYGLVDDLVDRLVDGVVHGGVNCLVNVVSDQQLVVQPGGLTLILLVCVVITEVVVPAAAVVAEQVLVAVRVGCLQGVSTVCVVTVVVELGVSAGRGITVKVAAQGVDLALLLLGVVVSVGGTFVAGFRLDGNVDLTGGDAGGVVACGDARADERARAC